MRMYCRLATDIADLIERLRFIAESNAHAKAHGIAITPTLLHDWTKSIERRCWKRSFGPILIGADSTSR